MREINLKELIKNKIVPFNVYNEKGQVLIYAGDLLTPGKILEIKDLKIFLFDENYKQKSSLKSDNPLVKRRLAEKRRKQEERVAEIKKRSNPPEPVIEEVFEMNPVITPNMMKSFDDFDNLDISKYNGTVNKHSVINPDLQLKLKYFFSDIIAEFESGNIEITVNKLLELTDKIYIEIIEKSEEIKLLSKIKLIGEYQKCHALNVAILSGLIGKHLEYNEIKIKDLILSGLIHDIGRTTLNLDIAYKKTLTKDEMKEYSAHTIKGYKIIKDILKLKENIALVALEHHELSDGSGYPKGLTSDNISPDSGIIAVCNYYDNLTFNRTSVVVVNSRDAVKALLEMGSKKFLPNILYMLTNKFAFNDTLNFAQMIN